MDTEDELADLERDGAWLRRAALALTSDPGIAEDAAQTAWIRAWHRRSATGGATSRGWLMQVLRNSVRGHLRDGARRSTRERAVAVPEGSSKDDPLQRIELQRITLDAIESLDEPYRSTIVERFLDGRSIEEIARRSNTPRKTVETRSRRGIERLRKALEGRRDTRGFAVLTLLGEVAQRPDPVLVASASSGASFGIWIAAIAVSVLVAGAIATRETWSALEQQEQAPATRMGDSQVAARLGSSTQPASIMRTPAVRQDAGPDASTRGAHAVAFAEVINLDGEPMPGVEVAAVRAIENAPRRSTGVLTDASGYAALPAPVPGAGAHLVDAVSHESLSAVLRPRLLAGAVARVVVADQIASDVRIVDSAGAPIEGARIRAQVDVDCLERFGTGDGVESVPRWSVTTDAFGDAAVTGFPRHEAIEIELAAAGFVPAVFSSVELPAVVKLSRASDAGLVGRVLDPFGGPVPNAWVGAGELLVRTGPDGRFSIVRAPRVGELRAVAEGFQSVRRALVEGSKFVELQLTRRAERLPLVVDGAPPGDLLAVLEGEELFGIASSELNASTFHASVSAEALATGRYLERVEPAILRSPIRRATIKGLASRPYQLSIVSVDRAEVVATLEVVPASAELHIPSARLGAVHSVVGNVISDGGRPVRGAEVRIGPGALDVPPRLLRRTVTDQTGTFRFEGIGGAAWTLFVSHEPGGSAAAIVDVDRESAQAPLEIELPVRRRARVHVADPELGTARLTLLDSSDHTVPMISRVGQSTVRCQSLTLGDGRTGVLEFSRRAAWVLLETRTATVRRRLPARGDPIEDGVEVLVVD